MVSINPYRKFNLYTPERIAEYRSRNIYELPPHMWVQLNVWKQRIMNCFESLEAVDVVVWLLCQSVPYKLWIKKSVFYPWLASLFSILGQDTLVTKCPSLDPLGSDNKMVIHEAHPWWANSSTSRVQYQCPLHLGHLHFPVIHAVLNTWSYFEISLAVWIGNVSLALI